MLHLADDYQALCRVCGTVDKLPERVEREYLTYRHLFHSLGGSGFLPPMLLAIICRNLGIVPPGKAKLPEATIQWADVKRGTLVEAFYRGQWQVGTYLRNEGGGLLAVQIDGIEDVQAMPIKHVRLATTPDEAAVADALAQAPNDVDRGAVVEVYHDGAWVMALVDRVEKQKVYVTLESDQLGELRAFPKSKMRRLELTQV